MHFIVTKDLQKWSRIYQSWKSKNDSLQWKNSFHSSIQLSKRRNHKCSLAQRIKMQKVTFLPNSKDRVGYKVELVKKVLFSGYGTRLKKLLTFSVLHWTIKSHSYGINCWDVRPWGYRNMHFCILQKRLHRFVTMVRYWAYKKADLHMLKMHWNTNLYW